MVQIVLIGLGAGAAAALLFASVASGSSLATLLFYLAPLPILIAALGWSHWAGARRRLDRRRRAWRACSACLFSVAFLVGVGLPAWWLGYLALLARPVAQRRRTLEWYPVGRLVLWAALIGALLVAVAIPNFGTDEATFAGGLARRV